MSLALPPSTDTDSTVALFTTYSLSNIFKTGLVENMLGKMSGGTSDPCCCTIGTYLGLQDGNICTAATSCTNPTTSCSAKSQSTDTIVTGINSFCVANPTNNLCTDLAYIFKMSNPSYFNSTGFVGTNDYNTPTSGYDGLSTSGITFDSANTIKDLTISFDQTPITTIN